MIRLGGQKVRIEIFFSQSNSVPVNGLLSLIEATAFNAKIREYYVSAAAGLGQRFSAERVPYPLLRECGRVHGIMYKPGSIVVPQVMIRITCGHPQGMGNIGIHDRLNIGLK